MHLWLTGFMGAGKSTAGRKIARILGYPFVDCDAELERRNGTIASIFADRGEAGFRALESALIAEIDEGASSVIATGGGAVIAGDNRTLMRSHGVIVHLAISPSGALARVGHRDHRPLLGTAPDLATISSTMSHRASAYADHDFRVGVEGKTPSAVAHIVARWFRRRLAQARDRARA